MDMPDISTDLDTPLPESPDPTQTPYRIVARPGAGVEGPENVVTGWGPRRPIVPPAMQGQSTVGPPDMSNAYQAAFSHLPIDEAKKVMEVASKYVAMRGYQSDLQSGKSAPEAWVKWAPMLLGGGATGVPEALRASNPPQISPYQQASLNDRTAARLSREKLEQARLAAQTPKLDEVTKTMLQEDVKGLKKVETEIDKATEANADPKVIDTLRTKAGFLRNRIESYKTPQAKPSVAPAPRNPAQPSKPVTPEEKLTAAKALRAAHPEWTKAQILAAVNQ